MRCIVYDDVLMYAHTALYHDVWRCMAVWDGALGGTMRVSCMERNTAKIQQIHSIFIQQILQQIIHQRPAVCIHAWHLAQFRAASWPRTSACSAERGGRSAVMRHECAAQEPTPEPVGGTRSCDEERFMLYRCMSCMFVCMYAYSDSVIQRILQLYGVIHETRIVPRPRHPYSAIHRDTALYEHTSIHRHTLYSSYTTPQT